MCDSTYAVILLRGHADGLEEYLQFNDYGQPDRKPAVREIDVTVILTADQVNHLKTLDSEHDGHIDSHGIMWIGGLGNPVRPSKT